MKQFGSIILIYVPVELPHFKYDGLNQTPPFPGYRIIQSCNELLQIENEQTRGVRFQSVMTVTDEGSHRSNHTRACPNSTGLYRVKMGHAPAYQLTSYPPPAQAKHIKAPVDLQFLRPHSDKSSSGIWQSSPRSLHKCPHKNPCILLFQFKHKCAFS